MQEIQQILLESRQTRQDPEDLSLRLAALESKLENAIVSPVKNPTNVCTTQSFDRYDFPQIRTIHEVLENLDHMSPILVFIKLTYVKRFSMIKTMI